MNDNHYVDAAQGQAIIRELAAKPGDLSQMTQMQTELEQVRRQIADLRRHNEAMAFRLRAYALKFETMAQEAGSPIDPDEFKALAADARAAAADRLEG